MFISTKNHRCLRKIQKPAAAVILRQTSVNFRQHCRNLSHKTVPLIKVCVAYTTQLYILTINVPVVFMARYIMILRGATSLRGALEGVGPENRDFFEP
jgi:hypothetical protein